MMVCINNEPVTLSYLVIVSHTQEGVMYIPYFKPAIIILSSECGKYKTVDVDREGAER